jgi:hypothetical protein
LTIAGNEYLEMNKIAILKTAILFGKMGKMSAQAFTASRGGTGIYVQYRHLLSDRYDP